MAVSRRFQRRLVGASVVVVVAVVVGVLIGTWVSGTPRPSGPEVTVSPLPGSQTAPPATQISIVGVPASRIGQVIVTGSESGTHAGKLEAYSQGDGASFVPDKPFTAGEVVSVQTHLDVAGAGGGSWQFHVGQPFILPPPPSTPTTTPSSGNAAAHAHYVTNPSLDPPQFHVDVDKPGTAAGDVFISPSGNTGQDGVEILDNTGQPVWFDPVGHALDFKPQMYLGKPVLTFWLGKYETGFGLGRDVVMNSSYQQIAQINGGNGLKADLHECVLHQNGTAFISAYQPLYWNLTSVGGPAHGQVIDSVLQVIDVKTGLVRYQWDSLDHVDITQSYMPYSKKVPYDYFHINSIQPYGKSLIISGRNVDQVYEVNQSTGHVIWQLGGKHSTFTMGKGTSFAWQHDAELHPDGTISLFDDEGAPNVKPPSRGIILKLDTKHWTATLVRQLVRSPSVVANSQGNVQELPNGDQMVGWGSVADETEFTSSGAEDWDLVMPSGESSYRVFRDVWHGTPTVPPALVVENSSRGGSGGSAGSAGSDTAYMSWNGATSVASWRILGGSSASSLSVLTTSARKGFETRASVPVESDYQVEALDGAGKVIGKSAVVTPRMSSG